MMRFNFILFLILMFLIPSRWTVEAKNSESDIEHYAIEREQASSFAQAATVRDKEIRKKAMKGARDLAVKAKEMGTTSAQVQSLLLMPSDGGDPPKGSGKNQVEVAMMEGESAFAQGDTNHRSGDEWWRDQQRNLNIHVLFDCRYLEMSKTFELVARSSGRIL